MHQGIPRQRCWVHRESTLSNVLICTKWTTTDALCSQAISDKMNVAWAAELSGFSRVTSGDCACQESTWNFKDGGRKRRPKRWGKERGRERKVLARECVKKGRARETEKELWKRVWIFTRICEKSMQNKWQGFVREGKCEGNV